VKKSRFVPVRASADEISDEFKKYGAVETDAAGEIDVYEKHFFYGLVRRRELEIIFDSLLSWNPKAILDYGCGAGWLSTLLVNKGFDVVGVDISAHLVRNARKVCPNAQFVVCDAEKLPFRNSVFDCVIGIAILHHLRLEKSCNEVRRVLGRRSKFIFMEPNLLNPISAVGRRFFPTEAHTKGEKQFVPRYLRTALNQSGFTSERCFNLFFFTVPLARLFKITKIEPHSLIIRTTSFLEDATESIPAIRHLNSIIVAIGKTSV
jgi:SAM-dependent methyltransferase